MTRPARGLGRGLASLIPDDAFDEGPSVDARSVPIDEIRPNPEQPREAFDDADLAALADSIRLHGVLSPLVVRRDEGRYYLVAGERRLRAAARAGLREVPVVVREARRPAEQLELALVENLLRSDLDPIEAAQGYARLVDEHGLTKAEVARRVGLDRATVSNAIRLLGLPELARDALRRGEITAGHARALLPVDDPGALRRLLARVVSEALSVRATERLVRRWADGTDRRRKAERRVRKQQVAEVDRLLSRRLDTRVAVEPRQDGGGRIVIDYADRDQLDALIERLGRA